jgi:hypothetical protein
MIVRTFLAAALMLAPFRALACDAAVCRVDPDTLVLAQIIHFDDHPSGWDPGYRIDETLILPGASFAEHFAGMVLTPNGDFDAFTGMALPPLTLLPGAPGQTLSVVHMLGSNILNGFGPAGYPHVQAQGEGSIAILFDEDQPALALQILGGEDGEAVIQFWSRAGVLIHTEVIATKGPLSLGFERAGNLSDIAGLLITNTDPQGLAIDNLRFGPAPGMG